MKVESIFDASVPILVLIALGYLCSLAGLCESKFYQSAIQFVIEGCLPFTVFYNLTFEKLEVEDLVLLLSELVASAVVVPFMYIFRAFYKEKRLITAELFSTTNISNLLLSGVQITGGFYNPTKTEKYAYIQSFAQCLLHIPASIVIYDISSEGKDNLKATTKKVVINTLKSPLVISVLISLIANVIRSFAAPDLQLPVYIRHIFTLFSQMTSTLGIACIGMFIHHLSMNSREHLQPFYIVLGKFFLQGALKSFVFPLAVMFCMKLTNLDKESVKINVSLSACHSGVMTFGQASQYNVEVLIAGLMVAGGLLWTVVYTIAFDALIDRLW